MIPFPRRGACPSLTAPMQTGDGLLLRLSPPWEGWSPAAFEVLAEAALRFGNGLLEITARGNLQLRGFQPGTVPPFADALARAGITEGPAGVLLSPLGGEDPDACAAPQPVASAIVAALPRLAPKVCVAVDGGGSLHLDALDADIRLQARDATTWHLWAGRIHLGLLPQAQAAASVLGLLETLARHGPDARMRDVLAQTGGKALHRPLPHLMAGPAPVARRPAQPIGLHGLRTGTGLGIAFPFGTITAAGLAAFARAASGARALRPAPGRALLALGLRPGAAGALRQAAGTIGLITTADDPRLRIAACPGAPACASAEGATRPLAEILATHPALPRTGVVHLSGCRKGCAHPAPSAITLVGQAGGFGLVLGGTARATPTQILPPEAIPAALERLA